MLSRETERKGGGISSLHWYVSICNTKLIETLMSGLLVLKALVSKCKSFQTKNDLVSIYDVIEHDSVQLRLEKKINITIKC